MKKLILETNKDNMSLAAGFLEEEMEQEGLDQDLILKMDVVIDEILSNIVYYSESKYMQVGIECRDSILIMEFADDGTPYDPTATEKTGLEHAFEDESIGGWGIMLVKKMTDELHYTFENHQNILMIKKHIEL